MKNLNSYVFVVFFILGGINAVIFPGIPDYLLPCYRSDGPLLSAPYRLDVLLSTLRTLERNTQLDLRLFTTSLLRSLRLDGIERGANGIETEFVTPYHASGFQFHKYQLLMNMFLPSQELNLLADIEASLTVGEICMLHKILSSTVNSWERGDESRTCPEVRIERSSAASLNSTRARSRCPIEQGVIQTDWGVISPGTVVSAIAASLEAQRVLVKDILNNDVFRNTTLDQPIDDVDVDSNIESIVTDDRMVDAEISNVWVATLAGDLAEIAVIQGPRIGSQKNKFIIGGMSRWNDTLLPRIHYMLNHTNGTINWQFTDSEILAGIDGVIIAHHLPSWMEQRESLRLSQILEMYYSSEGITFDRSVKACNRRTMFQNLLESADLFREVSNFAQVLSLQMGSVFIPVAEMDDICQSVITAFMDYYPSVLTSYERGCGVSGDVPDMDLIVATDGAWTGYDVEQFTSWLGDAADVGLSRSSLGLLHGNTASWISAPSNNLTLFFEQVHNDTGGWPTRMNFPNILSFLMRHLENKTLSQAERGVSVSPSTVVLVVAPSDRLSETESSRVQDLMATLRTTHFDVYFDYVAQDLRGFKAINSGNLDYSEFFFQVSSTRVEDVIRVVGKEIIVSQVPKAIIGPHCTFNNTTPTQFPYEDFVEQDKSNGYRIHPYYLKEQPLVLVEIRNGGQGALQVCYWRGSESSKCHNILERQSHAINFTDPCPSTEHCRPAHIKISGISSTDTCANNDCRFPHSIGYHIEHSGLRCLQIRSFGSMLKPIGIHIVIILAMTLLNLFCSHVD